MPDVVVTAAPEAVAPARRGLRGVLKSPRKVVVALVSAGLVAASGGAAYAYWTSGGTGTGTATAGTTVGVAITGTVAGTIYPGGTFTVVLKANNTNSSTVKIGTVSATGFAVTGGNDATACNALIADATVADFSMANVAENQTLAAATNNIALTNNGTLVFTNSVTENQDACKGAALTITLSATAGA
jgi:hypothetical protein